MTRTPLELGDLWAGEPEPRPRWRDVVAACLVFLVLPGVVALVTVGAYVAAQVAK